MLIEFPALARVYAMAKAIIEAGLCVARFLADIQLQQPTDIATS